MAKYIVVHTPLIKEADQNELFAMMHSIAASQVPDTKWLNSWLSVDSSRMFCLWEAPDEGSIREAIGDYLPLTPIESAFEVVLVDPDYFG